MITRRRLLALAPLGALLASGRASAAEADTFSEAERLLFTGDHFKSLTSATNLDYEYRKRLAAGVPKSRLMAQALRRAAVLFVFGLLVYAFPHFDLGTQRILGVLQRIAVCYLIACAIYL